jgi:hypothetical protein
MIYKEHKFIFIHIHKVAGKSMIHAFHKFQDNIPFKFKLWNKIYSKPLNKKLIYPDYLMLDTHTKAIEYKKFLGDDYDKLFKFAFVRNPLDWQVSMYFFMKEQKDHFQHDIINKLNFNEYIDWRVNEDLELQKSFVVDENNNLIVDFIGKFENIQKDFNKVCDRLDIRTSLPHINKSKHKPYYEYFDKKTSNMIIEAYEEDYNFFGYEKKLI